MKAEKDRLEKSVKALKNCPFPSGPDRQTIDSTIAALAKASGQTYEPLREKQTITERIITMKTYSKLAVAAALVIAAVLTITLLDRTVTPAWAIEDTIKALEDIRAVKLVGKMTQWTGGVAEVIIWATPDANGDQSEYARMDAGGQILTATPQATYRYWPGINKVRIEKAGSFTINPWLGKNFFETIKDKAVDWSQSAYDDLNKTGAYVVVNCKAPDGSKSWSFVFDVETKLPVSFRQISNVEESDVREIEFSQIEYNPELPEGIFEFEIPEGAEVVYENNENAEK